MLLRYSCYCRLTARSVVRGRVSGRPRSAGVFPAVPGASCAFLVPPRCPAYFPTVPGVPVRSPALPERRCIRAPGTFSNRRRNAGVSARRHMLSPSPARLPGRFPIPNYAGKTPGPRRCGSPCGGSKIRAAFRPAVRRPPRPRFRATTRCGYSFRAPAGCAGCGRCRR